MEKWNASKRKTKNEKSAVNSIINGRQRLNFYQGLDSECASVSTPKFISDILAPSSMPSRTVVMSAPSLAYSSKHLSI